MSESGYLKKGGLGSKTVLRDTHTVYKLSKRDPKGNPHCALAPPSAMRNRPRKGVQLPKPSQKELQDRLNLIVKRCPRTDVPKGLSEGFGVTECILYKRGVSSSNTTVKNVRMAISTLILLALGKQRSKGFEVSHLCGNYRCVNKDHIVFESSKANQQRKNCPSYFRIPECKGYRIVDGEEEEVTVKEEWFHMCDHEPPCQVVNPERKPKFQPKKKQPPEEQPPEEEEEEEAEEEEAEEEPEKEPPLTVEQAKMWLKHIQDTECDPGKAFRRA